MGEITIKVPQNINRSFVIGSKSSADEILRDLERRSTTNAAKNGGGTMRFNRLKTLVKGYRNRPDSDTISAITTANEWRERWQK